MVLMQTLTIQCITNLIIMTTIVIHVCGLTKVRKIGNELLGLKMFYIYTAGPHMLRMLHWSNFYYDKWVHF